VPNLNDIARGTPEGWEPVPAQQVTGNPPPPSGQQNLEPGFPTNMRCPVPPSSFTPDASKQFYRGSSVPQFRAFAPAPLSGNNNSSGSSTTTVQSSSTTTTETVTLSVKNASITTPVLNPSQAYTSTLTLSRAFAIFQVTATAAARIRLYATAATQTLDLSRASTAAPAFGTTQGLILDLTLDTSPYQWLCSPIPIGANGDSPTSPASYITITQIAPMSGPITASVQYLPLES
jgi:hypothetical protein